MLHGNASACATVQRLIVSLFEAIATDWFDVTNVTCLVQHSWLVTVTKSALLQPSIWCCLLYWLLLVAWCDSCPLVPTSLAAGCLAASDHNHSARIFKTMVACAGGSAGSCAGGGSS